jgi:GNAT superfamily N-acetyltransferase
MSRSGSGELVIAPLSPDHVPDVAALVATRVRMLRTSVPAVPATWEDETVVARLVLELALRGTGCVALRDGTPMGFQAGTMIDGHGARWAYTPDLGHAASGATRGRVISALYASLAEGWIRDACLEHVVTVFADDIETIEAYGRLGFGRTVVDLVRDLSPVRGARFEPGVTVRRAGTADTPAVHLLDLGLRRHLLASPIFRRLGPQRSPELERHLLADTAAATFLAEADGKPVAFLRIGPSATDVATIVRDPGTASVTAAFTVPELRGEGVATALLSAAHGWARDAGYARIAVDHESANGDAERFWMRHFVPVAYGLTRRLAPRGGP